MRAYERFLNYIQYDTASDADSPTCPSTEKQLALGRALAGEMKAMGIADARIDEYGSVEYVVDGKSIFSVEFQLKVACPFNIVGVGNIATGSDGAVEPST